MEFEKMCIEDLLADESFINYCRKSSPVDIEKWESFIGENPECKPLIDAAITEFKNVFMILAAEDLAEQEAILFNKISQPEPAPVVQMNIKAEKKTKNYLPLLTKIAAASVIVFLIVFFKDRFPGFGKSETVKTFVSAHGERKNLQLPDGSGVTLNGGSKITIPGNYGSVSRDIYLEGEAFFDVKHNEALPFIVHTPAMDIKALGTAFNVKAYPCDKTTETSLIRGLVEITLKEEKNRTMLLHPNQKIQWMQLPEKKKEPGTQIKNHPGLPAVTPVQKLTKTETGIVKEIAWTENKLVFADEPFEDIAVLLERWYGAKIEFLENEIRSYRFTGEFEKEELGTILSFLKESRDFNYDMVQGSTLTVKLYK